MTREIGEFRRWLSQPGHTMGVGAQTALSNTSVEVIFNTAARGKSIGPHE